jgi:integrase
VAKYTKRKFQVGEYWLSQKGERAAWCRTWLDADARQTRRVSLGTDDFEEAKRKLAEWYAAQFQAPSDDLPPSAVKLAAVLLDYWNGQACKLRSAETSKIHLRYWNEYWGDVSVAEVRSVARQEAFRLWLSNRGLAHNTCNRCLEAGRAAIRRAWKRGVISAAPYIQMLPEIETEPMGRPLSVDEWGAILHGATQPHVKMFIAIALATGARPEAITDLTWDQLDFDNRLIYLNPPGRVQNKKRRPTLKMPESLARFIEENKVLEFHSTRRNVTNIQHVVTFRGKRVSRLDISWRKALAAAGLKDVALYSPRTTAARWMSQQGVPLEQIAQQLGHKMKGYGVTYRYVGHQPDYLSEACAALDKLLFLCLDACRSRAAGGSEVPPVIVGALEPNKVKRKALAAK